MLHCFFCFYYLSGWVWWRGLLNMLNMPQTNCFLLVCVIYAAHRAFGVDGIMLEHMCIVLDDDML